jgi:hypothetical protein
MEGVKISALKMAPNQKTFNMKILGNFEGYNFDVLSFFIRGRLQPQNYPKPNCCPRPTCNPSSVRFGRIWTGFEVLFLQGKPNPLINR